MVYSTNLNMFMIAAHLLGLALATAGCQKVVPLEVPTAPARCGTASAAATRGGSPLALAPLAPGERAVTFAADLLPILTSAVPGAVYRCTTCHAHYAAADGLNNAAEVAAIIKSMETKSMPRGGNTVPADKIALFATWQRQGYPKDAASTAASGVPANTVPPPGGAATSTTGTAGTTGGLATGATTAGRPTADAASGPATSTLGPSSGVTAPVAVQPPTPSPSCLD